MTLIAEANSVFMESQTRQLFSNVAETVSPWHMFHFLTLLSYIDLSYFHSDHRPLQWTLNQLVIFKNCRFTLHFYHLKIFFHCEIFVSSFPGYTATPDCRFLRFTSGAISTNPIVANMAVNPLTHILFQALVRVGTCVLAWSRQVLLLTELLGLGRKIRSLPLGFRIVIK